MQIKTEISLIERIKIRSWIIPGLLGKTGMEEFVHCCRTIACHCHSGVATNWQYLNIDIVYHTAITLLDKDNYKQLIDGWMNLFFSCTEL